MLVVPLTTESYLRRIVDALMGSDYAGLMVILGRTAEMREQHQEFTKDWTSFHDLTSTTIAVLCPDPPAQPYDSAVRHTTEPEAAYSPGISLVHPGNPGRPDRHAFEEAFWGAARRYAGGGIPKWERADQELDVFSVGRRRFSHEEHHAAWTEVTSRCALHFGIAEAQIPSVLLLSRWEKVAILVRLDREVELYRLIKQIVSILEDRPKRSIEMRQEFDRAVAARRDVERQEKSWRKRDSESRRIAMIRGKVSDLNYQLSRAREINHDLIARCQAVLSAALTDDQMPSDDADLKTLHRATCSKGSHFLPRHSEVWAVRDYFFGPTAVTTLKPPIGWGPQELAAASERIDKVEADMMAARKSIRLADAAISSAVLQGWSAPQGFQRGTKGLSGWKVVELERADPLSIRTVKRRS